MKSHVPITQSGKERTGIKAHLSARFRLFAKRNLLWIFNQFLEVLLLWLLKNQLLIKFQSSFRKFSNRSHFRHGRLVSLFGIPPPFFFFFSARPPPFFILRPCSAQSTPPQIHSPALEARLIYDSLFLRFLVLGFDFLGVFRGFWWISCVDMFLCVLL